MDAIVLDGVDLLSLSLGIKSAQSLGYPLFAKKEKWYTNTIKFANKENYFSYFLHMCVK
jgi:hypothetical protein